MNERMPDLETTSDQREIRGFCVRAIQDVSTILTTQVGSMLDNWFNGKTPHLNGEMAGAGPEAKVRTRTEQTFLAVNRDWL
eukprot:CAMPEP_0206057018 /NCGR_PEP_ID=MMETSP1466-20131121/43412_1 /ASSEMBLY_ACC=CAM_ASM_001126 /TAXON_ID=44452 /ORGANISM="Pavlova gyrans, Strain CCMP608" /LENGTH=80 /DNA_ID=CAMNT_0053432275 /DNA_START=17 /DNA_END=256 /DNA_ORIENTATION=-